MKLVRRPGGRVAVALFATTLFGVAGGSYAFAANLPGNLAVDKSVTASGTEVTDGRFTAAMAADGDMSEASRWSGAKTDEQWLQVDMGSVKTVSEIVIRFHAEPTDWELLVSADGKDWKQVHEVVGGKDGGVKEDVQISIEPQDVRYLKFVQHKMWTHSGNKKQYSTSIYEIEAYQDIDIQGIAFADAPASLGVGESFTASVTLDPAEAKGEQVVFSSSNDAVATVSADGVVTAKGAGRAIITVASKDDPKIAATHELRVIDGFGADFTQSELAITPRDKRFLSYSVTGDMPEGAKVAYEVEGSAVTVNKDGMLSAKEAGTATVKLLVNGTEQDTLKVTVAAPDYEADYDTMMDRWIERVTGGDEIDLSDQDIAAYVAKISTEGKQLWEELDMSEGRDRLWPKVASDSTSADYTTQFTKIKKLALAFRVKGSELYQNGDLLQDIVDAVNFMVKDKKYNGSYTTGNWWDWQIGCTHPLCDILMIVSDYTDYKNIEPAVKAIEGYAKEPSKRFNGYTETGANRTDTGLAVLGSAIVAKNDTRMQMIPDQVPDVMKLVTSGDGLYADGSVVQHTKVAYTGAYGNELIKGIGRINSIIAGTKWDITDARITNVYETVLNGYIPLMHRGQQMAAVNGRSISRAPGLNPFTTEFESGSETISNILLVAQFAPEPYRSAYNAAVKGWLEDSAAWTEDFDFYGHARDFDALLQAKALLADDSVEASTWTGMKVYGSMDRVVQANESYQAALAMYSKRIYNYEAAVGSGMENARGWHTGDGMLYVYNNDLKQFGEGFWPTVDSYRLPGTTVDTRELADTANQSKTSPQSWVGGTTDGENGAAGMAYNANGMSGMNVTAKKSWFFLPGQIVALGADIDGTTYASIETTVENRMITSEDNAITINGERFAAAGDDAESMKLADGSYAHFTGTGEGNDLGYYFIQGGDVDVARETRSGSYADINGVFPSDTVYTKQYFKMGLNHGKTAENASYAYVILPGASETDTAAYAETPGVEVLKNDEAAQAVLDAADGIFAMNTWPESEAGAGGFTVDNSASVYVQVKDGAMTISLSNPKQNNVAITLSTEHAYSKVASMDEGVTKNEDGSFTFDTTGLKGGTQTVVLEVGDTSALTELLEQAGALAEGDYTAESWSALVDAVADAEKVLEGFAPAQEALDAAADKVQAAIDGLEKPAPVMVTVTFDDLLSHTDNQVIEVESGSAIDRAQVKDPVCDGWHFDGWFADAGRTAPFDFDAPVTEDATVYAKWTKVEEPGDGEQGGEQGGTGEETPQQPEGEPQAQPDQKPAQDGNAGSGHLAQTGDASVFASVAAAVGSALSGIGAVIVSKRKR